MTVMKLKEMLKGKRPELSYIRSLFAQAPLEREEAEQGKLVP